jgi:hypothetical protein
MRCSRCDNNTLFVATVAEWTDYRCTPDGELLEFQGGEIHGVTGYRCAMCYGEVPAPAGPKRKVKKPTPAQINRLHPRSNHQED